SYLCDRLESTGGQAGFTAGAYNWLNESCPSIEEPSIEERVILFLEAHGRVKKDPLFKRA
ncbi:hypothetical protein Tco_0022048, partial [Tanacetum coccineum]